MPVKIRKLPMHPSNGNAAALQHRADRTEQAAAVIDRDPQEALSALAPVLNVAPNVGEITQADMFRLMSQLMQQQNAMQAQIVELMAGGQQKKAVSAYSAEEIARDKLQRDLTLKSWNEEPREPVWIQPDGDEAKIHAVTGGYPPRMYRVNGLEFPITVGEIVNVPSSIARQVEWTQKKRPYSGPPQALGMIPDPQRGQFLNGSVSQTLGNPGRSGEGRLIPDSLPPHPQELGLKYDANGQ